jgi:hypothetical protein
MSVELLFVEESPQTVTTREKKPYAFDFADLLGQAETVASCHEAKLVEYTALTDVSETAIIGSPSVASPLITVTVDWGVVAITKGRRYLLYCVAVIGSRREELVCEFRTFFA